MYSLEVLHELVTTVRTRYAQSKVLMHLPDEAEIQIMAQGLPERLGHFQSKSELRSICW